MAEDFLSPIVAGLAFRDVLSFIIRWLPGMVSENRGERIERAMAAAYAKFVHPETAPVSADGKTRTGLAAGLAPLLPGASSTTPFGNGWRPLLILNTTHVETGRRVVISHLAPCYTVKRSGADIKFRLFPDAYDIFEKINTRTDPSCLGSHGASNSVPKDIALVAAAHNSARFPVLSPAAALISSGTLRGRLVDGGYFENYGAQSVLDLVDSLLYDFDLRPFVILITNDPSDEPPDRGDASWMAKSPPRNDTQDRIWFETFASVRDTIFNTRGARGSLAIRSVRQLVHAGVNGDLAKAVEDIARKRHDGTYADYAHSCMDIAADSIAQRTSTPGEGCFAHLFVPRNAQTIGLRRADSSKERPVSMSWWLSKPTQEYLDDMLLCFNTRDLEAICRVVATQEKRDKSERVHAACLKHIVEQQKEVCPRPDTEPLPKLPVVQPRSAALPPPTVRALSIPPPPGSAVPPFRPLQVPVQGKIALPSPPLATTIPPPSIPPTPPPSPPPPPIAADSKAPPPIAADSKALPKEVGGKRRWIQSSPQFRAVQER
jgi:hypothetical protein